MGVVVLAFPVAANLFRELLDLFAHIAKGRAHSGGLTEHDPDLRCAGSRVNRATENGDDRRGRRLPDVREKRVQALPAAIARYRQKMAVRPASPGLPPDGG